MAASKKTINLGILAEDQSDVEVVAILLRRMTPNVNVGVKNFIGHGCGKLRSKCLDWAKQLRHRGCSVLLFVHDLDRCKLHELRERLKNALFPSPISQFLILIPVEELESWMMCDAEALKAVFSLKKLPKCPSNPETISSPKERLEDLIWRESNKQTRYLHTVHNSRIAAKTRLATLRKCKAFHDLEKFWHQVVSD